MTTGISFQNGSFLNGTAGINTSSPFGGSSVSSFYNEDFLNSKYDYQHTREGYEIQESAYDAALDVNISNIISYIENGQEDKAMEAYNQLLSQMSTQSRYSHIANDNAQLQAIAKQLIEMNLEDGNLEDLIRDNTRDAVAVQKQKCYRGRHCDSTTQEQLLKSMCGLEEEEGHMNILQTLWHGTFGLVAKAWNGIFGDGKKH